MSGAPPRVFCIPATAAPVVAVLRRGPTEWWHVGLWDLATPSFEPGAWIHAQLYPQKCDLSPDGRWLVYSALDPDARWAAGTTYEAVSRLPWLHALAAWEAGTTYTRGLRFVDRGAGTLGPPDVGDDTPLRARLGLAPNPPEQFSVERRRGWTETSDSEPRRPGDTWDERRRARLAKPRPGGGAELRVEGSYAAFRNAPALRKPAAYSLRTERDVLALDGVQWADWDATGRLLLVTRDGRLQIHANPGVRDTSLFDHDLTAYRPVPAPPPPWAKAW